MRVLKSGVAAVCFASAWNANPALPPCLSLKLPGQPDWAEDPLPDEKVYSGSMAKIWAGATESLWFLGGNKVDQNQRELRACFICCLEIIALIFP